MNKKEIKIIHYCFGYEKQCLLCDRILNILKESYPDDILYISTIEENVNLNKVKKWIAILIMVFYS